MRFKGVGTAVVLTLGGALVGVQSIMFPVSPLDALGANLATWTAGQGDTFISAIRFATTLGDAWVIMALGAISVAAAAMRSGGSIKRLAMPVTGMVGVWLLNELIKVLVSRGRPTIPWLIDESAASGHSFPSGHAMNSMGCLSVMAMTLPARHRGWARIFAFLLSIVIGLSRTALGVHYLSDVVAGWCFGLAFANVYRTLISSKWIRRGLTAAGKYKGI